MSKNVVEKLDRLAYTRQEVANLSGVSYETVKRAHHSGALKAKRTSPRGDYRYLAADVKAWLESLPDG